MSRMQAIFEKAFKDGGLDLRTLMESFDVRFGNLSLDDVRFVESECREVRQKFEDAEKVDCYKTRELFWLGFDDTAYFSVDEIELVKKLANENILKGHFTFEIKKIRISQAVLEGHIKDRKQWEKE
ncbi:hypothetical protein [Acinetobacter nosocomialis]|uniref:hypothetical protein n=1 Tax=Acinetobacter nosocomialis TaxID=106654 RepID=UPI0030068F24